MALVIPLFPSSPFKRWLEKWTLRPFEEVFQVLSQPEIKKTILFSVLNFFLEIGVFGGYFGANAI
jgi:hypothetical protein